MAPVTPGGPVGRKAYVSEGKLKAEVELISWPCRPLRSLESLNPLDPLRTCWAWKYVSEVNSILIEGTYRLGLMDLKGQRVPKAPSSLSLLGYLGFPEDVLKVSIGVEVKSNSTYQLHLLDQDRG